MGSLKHFLSSVFLAIVYTSTTIALVTAPGNKHATHRALMVGRGLKVTAFHPESSFETFGQGVDHPLTKSAGSTIENSTISFIQSYLKITPSAVKFRTSHSGETASHAYVSQVHDGIPFANAVANLAFNRENKVVAFGSSFVTPKIIASSKPTVALEAAIDTAEKALDGKFNEHPATIEFLVKEDGTVVLTHVVQIQNEAAGTWYQAFVDAHSGELASVVDFVAQASYLVVPITSQTHSFQIVFDPQDLTASPFGWHSTTGTTNITTTSGNNVQAPTTPQSSPVLNFIYPSNSSTPPNTTTNMHAARVNAFYAANSIHDLAYRFGFTEPGFNFQSNNLGKGGAQNDPVIIRIQDSAGTNGADFSTPPDGQSPLMRLFLWTFTNPQRDGALDTGIVTHEYTHGITSRMTGGGTGRCLQTTEAGGLGEGWSDAMADLVAHTSGVDRDFVLGQFLINNAAGIRTHPYSTSASVNPLRYSSIKVLNEVHNIGEVWANILHNVYAALVAANGWSRLVVINVATLDESGGNYIFLHLFIDALLLQPCNPTFINARDAWIQADANRYAGVNKCTLWNAFASRGLGVGASGFVDSSAVPAGC